jgi:LEA14-like dessication related protein
MITLPAPSSRLVALLAALALPLLACASLVKQPLVRIVEVGVVGIGLSGATARVTLLVDNPNGFALDAKALDYRLAFLPPDQEPAAGEEIADDAWRTLVTGATPEQVRLPARDSTTLTVDIPFGYRELGQAVGGLLREGRLRYRFNGAFTVGSPVGDLRVPFDRTGLLAP